MMHIRRHSGVLRNRLEFLVQLEPNMNCIPLYFFVEFSSGVVLIVRRPILSNSTLNSATLRLHPGPSQLTRSMLCKTHMTSDVDEVVCLNGQTMISRPSVSGGYGFQ